MITTCDRCGIKTPFYEKGTFFMKRLESNCSSELDGFETIEDGLYAIEYDRIDDVLMALDGLKINYSKGLWQGGLSQTSTIESMFDLKELITRFRQRETVEYIQEGNFICHLQPIIDLKQNSIYGYESLLRSADPSKQIHPGKLFEVANETGLHSFLDQRARQAAIVTRLGQIEVGVKSFINFLPSTIYNPEFCLRHTFQIVEKYGIDPSDLVFEVVETEKIDDVEHLKRVLETYKRQGMKVALDDVGSGFATIEMLQLLQPDIVKIDRSYVQNCDYDEQNQAFLEKVRHISHNLGIKVLAEGIERKEELLYCRDIGIDYVQGFYIGKPSLHAAIPDLNELVGI